MSDILTLFRDANAAVDCGKVRKATALFRQIIELYPASNEAIDAVYFLSTGERRPVAGREKEDGDRLSHAQDIEVAAASRR